MDQRIQKEGPCSTDFAHKMNAFAIVKKAQIVLAPPITEPQATAT